MIDLSNYFNFVLYKIKKNQKKIKMMLVSFRACDNDNRYKTTKTKYAPPKNTSKSSHFKFVIDNYYLYTPTNSKRE